VPHFINACCCFTYVDHVLDFLDNFSVCIELCFVFHSELHFLLGLMDIYLFQNEEKKIQMNKKKKIIGEGYNEAESHSVRPTKVCKFD
jgi:hypothetical protein